MSDTQDSRNIQDPRTYCPMSIQGFEALRADLAANGVNIADTYEGTAEFKKSIITIGVEWHYEAPSPGHGGWLRIKLKASDWALNKAWPVIDQHVNQFVNT